MDGLVHERLGATIMNVLATVRHHTRHGAGDGCDGANPNTFSFMHGMVQAMAVLEPNLDTYSFI